MPGRRGGFVDDKPADASSIPLILDGKTHRARALLGRKRA
jgi:hypothetical protein